MSKAKYPPHPRLEATRTRQGLKRSALADRVGISYQHLYGIERGYNTPAVETLQLIANALGVELSEVTDGERSRVGAKGADAASRARTTAPAAEADEAAAQVRGAA